MRVTITNETANDVVLITLPSGGGQAIQSGGATTIEVDSGSQISFDQITVQDYVEGGGWITTLGHGFGIEHSPKIIAAMKYPSAKRKDPNAVDPTRSTEQSVIKSDEAGLMTGIRFPDRE